MIETKENEEFTLREVTEVRKSPTEHVPVALYTTGFNDVIINGIIFFNYEFF